jgi:hypothetical protein
MLREKLVLLLGEEFIIRDKSDMSYLLRMVWLSRSTAEFELASDYIKVNLDEVLSRIKQLLKAKQSTIQTILISTGVGSYLLRSKPEQTFFMYLNALFQETKEPILLKYGLRFRALF